MFANRIRLFVAEDHPTARKALVRLLGEEPDLTVVGQAADGKGALRQLAPTELEVVLMDVRMPGRDGVATAQILHGEFPHVCLVGMSVGPYDPEERAMCRAGAVTCVAKGDLPQSSRPSGDAGSGDEWYERAGCPPNPYGHG